MRFADDDKNHFDPVYLSSRVLVAAALVLIGAVVVMNALILDSFVPAALVSAADCFAVAAAFLAGNVYRLSDMRSRASLQARLSGETQQEILARLPPLRVIRFRFRVAEIGVVVAALMLLSSFLTVPFEGDEMRPLAAVAILGLAASAISFLCGLWTRPID